jgi:hypothetical protein
MYMPKTSISSRMKKFRRGALRIFPLDGQIQGEVVVATILAWQNLSCSIKSSYIFMKHGDHVQKISKFTFELSNCFKQFSFPSYLLVTLHLLEPLMDGEDSKDDKMGSTHPNLNPSNFLDYIFQGEHMRKNPFWVRPIVTLKP